MKRISIDPSSSILNDDYEKLNSSNKKERLVSPKNKKLDNNPTHSKTYKRPISALSNMSKSKSVHTLQSSMLNSSSNTTALNAPGITTVDKFCLKSAQTVNEMKKSMNNDAINLTQYETLLTDKINMLSRFLGFSLHDDLKTVGNDVFDEQELDLDVQRRLNQREQLSKVNNNH